MPEFLELTAQSVAVDVKGRRITGRIVPWGKVGYTSLGATRFLTGSIAIPDDPARVKMLTSHDANRAAVGVGESFAFDADGIIAKFYVPPGSAGDLALAEAASGLRDGLSVGVLVDAYDRDAETLVVTASRLNEVSLVTIPAFDDARVFEVAAKHTKGSPVMTIETPAPAAVEPPAVEPAPQQVTAAAAPVQLPAIAPAVQVSAPIAAPGTIVQAGAIVPPSDSRPTTLFAAAQLAERLMRAGASPQQLNAALADFVPADDAGGRMQPQWLGQAWSASRADRPLIDALSSRRLTSSRVAGYQWNPRLAMVEYAGNKGPITTAKVKTVPLTADVIRFAGGIDIDRIEIDLGPAGLVEELYQQGVDSYRQLTEAYAVTTTLAAATDISADATDVNSFLIAASSEAIANGAQVSFVGVSPDLWATWASATADEVPWWLRDQGVVQFGGSGTGNSAGGVRFFVDAGLGTGTMLAGDGRAATFFEEGSVPIRVEAQNIPNGGYDLGLFGYAAELVNDPTSIWKATVTPPAPLAAKK